MSSADDHRRTWVGADTEAPPSGVGHLTEMPATPEAEGRYLAGPPGSPRSAPESIGEGAIGRVLLLFDGHLGREVAVKELIRGARLSGTGPTGGPMVAAVDRFVREARVTAQLEHPGIVPVYELGRRDDGTLYYVMKRVRGQTLSEAIRAAPDVAARLKLMNHFVDLCHAVAYAHSRGVIHRDLKPQNIMVGEFGETVVLDWGLAKVRGEADTRGREIQRGVEQILAASGNTLDGATMGTPAYMSPEQAHGRVDAIDERSDIWSLGAVLYEILTGRPPYAGESAFEVLEQVRTSPPPLVRSRERRAPPELAAVCMKALERDPTLRYPDARSLARDVESWQTGSQVGAYRYAWWEVLGRTLVRHRTVVTVLSLAVLALCTAAIVFLRHLADERDRARLAESAAQEERNQARRTLAHSLVDRARTAVREGDATDAWVLAAGALDVEEDPDARGALVAGRSGWVPTLTVRTGVEDRCRGLVWSGDDRLLACVTQERLHLWDAAGAERTLAEPGAPTGSTGALAWSPDHSRLAAAGAGEVRVWDAGSGRVVATLATDPDVWLGSVAWFPDGRVVAGGSDGVVRAWRDGVAVASFPAHPAAIRALAVSADGARFATASADHTLRIWDGDTFQELAPLDADGQGGVSLAFAPDGRHLAAAGEVTGGDGLVRIWDVLGGHAVGDLAGHLGEVWSVSWTGDGRRLASGAGDGTVRVWDVEGRRAVGFVRIGGQRVSQVAFTRDGARLAAAGAGGAVVVWAVPESPGAAGLSVEPRAVNGVAWSPDGKRLAAGGEDGRLVVWDAERGRAVATPYAGSAGITQVAFLRGGTEVLVRTADWRARVVELVTGRSRLEAGDGTELWSAAAVSPDGGWLAIGTRVGLRLVDLATGGTEMHHLPDGRGVGELAWSGDGERLLLAEPGGGLRLARRDTGDSLVQLGTIDQGYSAPALSPDGRFAAAAVPDGRIVVWSLPDGVQRHVLESHDDAIGTLRFSPDGARLASAGWDRTLAIWDVARGRLLARVEAHRNRVTDVAWSPDGTRLATASADHTARIWVLTDLTTPGADLLRLAGEKLGLRLAGADVVLAR